MYEAAPTLARPEVNTNRLYLDQKPSIINNPPLDNLTMMVSIPVASEWNNGHFLRNLRGMLSQHIEKGESIEVNYIANLHQRKLPEEIMDVDFDKPSTNGYFPAFINLDKINNNSARLEAWNDHHTTIRFLEKIIKIQNLARKYSHSKFLSVTGISPVNYAIQQEQDPLLRDLLQLAAQKAGRIAISAIDTTLVNVYSNDYPHSHLQAARTIGMDYGQKRIDPEAIFVTYDADTIPQSNQFCQNLIEEYRKHPELTYLIANMTYQPASLNREHAAQSPDYQANQTVSYNQRYFPHTSQNSFRMKAAQTLIDISSSKMLSDGPGDDDMTTAKRLIGFFGDMQNKWFSYTPGTKIPVSLNADRLDGTIDAMGRNDTHATMIEAAKSMCTLGQQMYLDIPAENKTQIAEDIKIIKKQLAKQQKIQIEMNRKVVKAFLNMYDHLQVDEFYSNQSLQNEILHKPFGKALVHYLLSNRKLISSLDPNDIGTMKYFIGEAELPPNITEFTPFQCAMREYLGDYVDLSIDSLSPADFKDRPITDKRALLQSLIAEIISHGYVVHRYLETNERVTHDKNVYTQDIIGTSTREHLSSRRAWTNQAFHPSSFWQNFQTDVMPLIKKVWLHQGESTN